MQEILPCCTDSEEVSWRSKSETLSRVFFKCGERKLEKNNINHSTKGNFGCSL